MTPRLDVARVRDALDGLGPLEFLTRLPVNLAHARREGSGLRLPCPIHLGTDQNFSITVWNGRLYWRCWSVCHRDGDALALVAELLGLTARCEFGELLVEAARIAGVDGDTVEPTRVPAPPLPGAARGTPRPYPPRGEVRALWAAAVPVTKDKLVSAYITSRLGADAPDLVADRDLARVLLPDIPLPPWARFRGGGPAPRTWWDTGHRIIVPAYDTHGVMRSVRAWRFVKDTTTPKRLPPAGYRASGLVLAEGLARQILRTGAAPPWWPPDVPAEFIVMEGEPDFLAIATRASDADAVAPAVLGVVSGSITPELLARLPERTRVTVATHHDPAGDHYAQLIKRCAAGRHLDVRRARP